MNPPWPLTMPRTVDSPSPVPLPNSLVVKNGSKIWSSTSGAMPVPVSATVSTTYGPGRASGSRRASASPSTRFTAVISSRPPSGMASRALTHRFISIW
jgi:hypothetical protein